MGVKNMLRVRLVAVSDIHRHDAAPPVSTWIELEVPYDDEATLGEHQGAVLLAVHNYAGPCVVEARHVTTWGLGADSVWDHLVVFLQDHGPVIQDGLKDTAAVASITSTITSLLAKRRAQRESLRQADLAANSPIDIDEARQTGQEFLWWVRSGARKPDELLDGTSDENGHCHLTFHLRGTAQTARLTLSPTGAVIQYAINEAGQSTAETPSPKEAASPMSDHQEDG